MRFDFELEGRPGAAVPFRAPYGPDRDDASPPGATLARSQVRAELPAIARVAWRFGAPTDRVFAAWLDAGTAGRWLFATATRPIAEVAIDPRVGGTFRFVERRRRSSTEYAGRYLQLVAPRRLAFTLAVDAGRASIVTVEIAPRREDCELVLSQQPVSSLERERIEGRWTGILYGLGLVLRENDGFRSKGASP